MKKLLLLFCLLPLISLSQQNFTEASGGAGFSFLIDSLGNMWATGNNNNGQLGVGDTQDRLRFTQVEGNNWALVKASLTGAFALKKDGTLWNMGSTSTFPEVHTPTKIGADTDWKSIALGNNFLILLKQDGTLWSLGNNNYGQLGYPGGSTVSPKQIGNDLWTKIAAGENHAMAINKDGSLWTWGYGKFGALGNNSESNAFQPMLIDSIDYWVEISASTGFSYAITAQGELYAWGKNNKGQLGVGNRDNQYIPTRVNLPEPVKKVAAGGAHVLAIGNSGKLYGWGDNQYGQLGKFTAGEHLSPIQIGQESTYTAVFGGFGYAPGSGSFATGNHSIIIKNQGDIACLSGFNADGELGTGNKSNQHSFQCISSLATGINEYEANLVNIFPNPATNTLKIALNNSLEVTEIRILDQLGREISLLDKSNVNKAGIDIQHLKNGVYSLHLRLANGESINKIFIKE